MRFEFLQKRHEMDAKSGLHVLLESIVNSFPESAGAESSEITLYDNKDKSFTFAASTLDKDAAFSGYSARCASVDNDKIFTQRVMESKNPLIIDDVGEPNMSQPDRDMLDRLGIKSIAIFPLLAGGRFLGSLSFDYVRHAHRYSRQDINAMHSLADLAALMIDHAEKMQNE